MPPVSRDRCSPDKHYIVHRLHDIRSLLTCSELQKGYIFLHRETSDPSGTAQNEPNNKPIARTTPLVPGDQISDIIWRGSKLLGALYVSHAWTTHKDQVVQRVLGHNPPGHVPPGHLPPGHLPPGHLPPGHLPPRTYTPWDIYPLDTYPQDTYPLGHIPPGQIPPEYIGLAQTFETERKKLLFTLLYNWSFLNHTYPLFLPWPYDNYEENKKQNWKERTWFYSECNNGQ